MSDLQPYQQPMDPNTPTKSPQHDNNLFIHFKDVSVTTKIPSDQSQGGKNLFSPLVDAARAVTSCGKNMVNFHRIEGISGVIKPNSMTLVLNGPGGGSSTLLRTVAQKLQCDDSGSILYNGKTAQELISVDKVDVRKTVQYIDQVDNHLALLTVHETLTFSNSVTCVEPDPQRVETTINTLGLRECRDTYLGSAEIRGVSGGQKRRVTIGEALLSDAAVLCLDQYSNGLDASTALDITRTLKTWCETTGGAVLATLTQPTPEIYAQFDQLLLLVDGKCVYNGPTCDIDAFLNAMGYFVPHDTDLCDYLVNVLLNPQQVLISQRTYLRANKDKEAVKQFLKLQRAPKQSNKPGSISSSLGELSVLPAPSVSPDEMIDYYSTSPQCTALMKELDSVFDKSAPRPEITPTETAKKRFKAGQRHGTRTLLSLLLKREARIALRSLNTTIPRLAQAIILGLLYGGVYYMIPDNDFFQRISVILVSLTQVGFNSSIEVPIMFQSNFTINNQVSSSYYPSWTYVVASFLNSIPQLIIECTLFVIVTYFMTGAALAPGAFFVFLGIVILQSIQIGAIFKLLTGISGSLESANTITQCVISLGIVFGGFFLTRSNVPKWLLWLYWAFSPFSWTTRALAIVEFQQSKYNENLTVPIDVLDPTQGVFNIRRGDLYLEYADLYKGAEWIAYAVVYLVFVTIFCMWLHSWILARKKKSYELSRGTRRVVDFDALNVAKLQLVQEEEQQQQQHEQPQLEHEKSRPDLRQVEERINHDSEIAAINERSRNGAITEEESSYLRSQLNSNKSTNNATRTKAEPLQTLEQFLPITPTWLSFHDLKYTVLVKDLENGGMKERVLLNGINGYAEPGTLTALMGASGAGKTTLLDVLAGLKNTGVVEGKLLVNGQPATKASTSALFGYVQQFDSLHPYQTVYETLLFAARLRLPADVRDDVKKKVVDEIIDVLELESIRNAIIGNHKYPSLSPSQCKRVNIGVELVANPSVLFLDEPTTGLDSCSAAQVMRVVKKLASTRSVIVCLHQPSAEVFYLFDRIVLLSPGGNQVYYGQLGLRCASFIKYFNQCPDITPFQSGNPATWLIEATVSICQTDEEEQKYRTFLTQLTEHFKASKQYSYTMDCLSLLQRIKLISHANRANADVSTDHPNNDNSLIAIQEDADHLPTSNQIDPSKQHHTKSQHDNKPQHDVEMTHIAGTNTNSKSTNEPSLSLTIARNQQPIPTTTKQINLNSRPNIAKQFVLLFIRNHSSYWRDPLFLFNRLVTCLGLSIIFGLIYMSVTPDSQAGVLSLISAACVVVYFAATVHSSSLPAFETRPTFNREKASGFYTAGLWACCSLLNELIWIVPATVLTGLPCYWIVNFPADAGKFFLYLLAAYLSIVSYISTTIAISALSPNSSLATLLSASFLGLSFLYSGLTITLPQLATGWHWLVHIFPLSHAIHAMIQVFQDYDNVITLLDANNIPYQVSVADFIEVYLGMSYGRTWVHFGWLVLYIAVLQIIAFLATVYLNHQKR